jgi:hypothetical protein
VILPQLFSLLSSFYSEKDSRARLNSYGTSDYYNFVRDSARIRIDYVRHHSGGRDTFVFDIYKFVIAIDKAFSKLIRRLHREGVFPLKNDEIGHPLDRNVLDSFNQFSSNL